MIKDRVSHHPISHGPAPNSTPRTADLRGISHDESAAAAACHALLSGHFSGSDTELLVARDTFTYPPAPGCSEVRRAAARRPTALRYVVPLPP